MNTQGLSRKKIIEINAVKSFLQNEKINFDEFQIDPYPEEPADIFCKDLNKKFQITCVPAELWAAFGKIKKGRTTETRNVEAKLENIIAGRESIYIGYKYKPEEVWQKFVVEPINLKRKYSKSARGITLLIYSFISEPFWLEKQIRIAQKANSISLKNLRWNEINLVFFTRNLRIYPPSVNKS